MEKYKSYGALSKTTHFLSVFCGTGVVQQRTEAQAGVVQDGLSGLMSCDDRVGDYFFLPLPPCCSTHSHTYKRRGKVSTYLLNDLRALVRAMQENRDSRTTVSSLNRSNLRHRFHITTSTTPSIKIKLLEHIPHLPQLFHCFQPRPSFPLSPRRVNACLRQLKERRADPRKGKGSTSNNNNKKLK